MHACAGGAKVNFGGTPREFKIIFTADVRTFLLETKEIKLNRYEISIFQSGNEYVYSFPRDDKETLDNTYVVRKTDNKNRRTYEQ